MPHVQGLAASLTMNTLPEATWRAFADHGHVGDLMSADSDDAELTLAELAMVGIDHQRLAEQLQHDGAASFSTSWNRLLVSIASKDGQRTTVAVENQHEPTRAAASP